MHQECVTDVEVNIPDSMRRMMEVFIQDLPKCVNRDFVDKVVSYIHLEQCTRT